MRNNIGVGSDQSKKDFEVRKRQYGRGAQYQVEQKGGATFMVAKKRNPPKRGSG